MKRCTWLVLAALGFLFFVPSSGFRVTSSAAGEAGEPFRTWRSGKGTEIQARLVRESGGIVTLAKEDGQHVAIRLSNLQAADRDYVAARRPKPRRRRTCSSVECTAPSMTARPKRARRSTK